MGRIKSAFRTVNLEAEDNFKQEKCLLLISVGQESHEGERFESTIELINKTFGVCSVSLYDSLQRHTMALNSNNDPEDFHALANKQGDLWLERNKVSLDKLNNLQTIFRWDTWLNHPDFARYRQELKELLANDSSYKDIFDFTVEKYLNRYCKQARLIKDFKENRAYDICMEYVLEECTVLRIWPELRYGYEAYPSLHNEAMEETRKRFITPNYPTLLRPLTIRFRNAPQLKPQEFELLEI